jgi:hypothetical protein
MHKHNLMFELMTLRLRSAHKHEDLDAALRTGWGWRVPRLEAWALEMLVNDAEEQLAAA